MRAWLLISLFASQLALAQVADPTRPADEPLAGGGGVANASGLQAIFVRPHGKSSAVIGGQEVRVGDKVNDKRVLKITENEVVVQGEGGRESLRLIAAVVKVPAATQKTSGRLKRHGTVTQK